MAAYVEVYQKCCSFREFEVYSVGEMCRLLEEDGIGGVKVDDVYWDFLCGE